jgi:hypothetical protein
MNIEQRIARIESVLVAIYEVLPAFLKQHISWKPVSAGGTVDDAIKEMSKNVKL